MSDDGYSSIPPKNGNERRQDRELRDLRADVKDNRVINDKEHFDIAKSGEANFHRLVEKIDEVKEVVSDLKGDSKGSKWVANVVRIVVASFVAVLGWLLLRDEMRMDNLEIWDAKHEISSEKDHGALRRSVDDNKRDIEKLQEAHRPPYRGPAVGPRDK